MEWLERLEGLRLNQEEFHKTQWEAKKRTDEIIELQQALSEANICINKERKHVLYLNHELDNTKSKFYFKFKR